MRRRAFLGSATACALSPLVSRAAAQVAPTQLVISPSTGEDAAGLYYAMQQGWFQQAGLELSVLPANGAAAMPAVIGGAVQIAYANVYSLVIAYKKGIPITLIAPGVSYVSATAFWQLLVAGDSPIHTPKDLQGKIIAVSELGDMAAFSVQDWLARAGVDPASVHFIELKPSAMPAALQAKRVDAVGIYDPYMTAAEAQGARSIAKPFDSIAPTFLEAAWFTTLSYASANRQTIQKFVSVFNRGAQYFDDHYTDLIPMISGFSKIDPTVLRKMPPMRIPPTLNPATIQPIIDAAAKYNAISGSFPARELIFS